MLVRWIAWFLGFAVSGLAWAQQVPPSPELVNKLLQQREALFDARNIDVPKLSLDIVAAVREGEKLESEARYRQALDRLLVLQKYMPLLDVPSLNVHVLATWLYGKVGERESAQAHMERAGATLQILRERVGKGETADDPVRVVMLSEVTDLTKSRGSRIVDIKTASQDGRVLLLVAYRGASNPNESRQLFVELDRRAQQQSRRQADIYAPIALAEMRPEHLQWLNAARQKREQFLQDASVPYLDLRGRLDELMKLSVQLDTQGKPADALAKIREIESIRPIEDIPTPRLIGWYSYLHGKTGQSDRQRELRGLLFGINQTIAHSGDGRSPETAIPVLFIDEEYEWLREKKLKMSRQAIRDVGTEKYDVLTVSDAQGGVRDVFFNITRMYAKSSASLMRELTGK